ncbi:MAG: SAM-dependent methyltransferase [Lachnospiraceae bacterium]|nr:SAM-dependent methyltransferase [Lachnospiraceae bacterium]
MEQKIRELFELYTRQNLVQATISNSTRPEEITKVTIRPIEGKQGIFYQAGQYRGTKVFHSNYDREGLLEALSDWFEGLFRQAELTCAGARATVLISKKGKVTIKEKKLAVPKAVRPALHNREKEYLIREGMQVPFLKELGVMTEDGTVVRARYDKFRQINRFLEFIDDVLPELQKRAGTREDNELRIIDFGCGKSYLTFAMYYYLHERKGLNVRVTGLDLKEDVIADCSALAARCGYEKLSFLHGDIASYEGEDAVDMIVTLHACDTATDYALHKAVIWNAAVILSVPCCQHELNKQIACEPLASVLGYGLIKERTAALFTDALRARLLECAGYRTQILEFIDMEHTPKNILLRCVKRGKMTAEERENKLRDYEACAAFLHADLTLAELLRPVLEAEKKDWEGDGA